MKWRMKLAALTPARYSVSRRCDAVRYAQTVITTDIPLALAVVSGEAEAFLQALGDELSKLFS